MGARAFTDEERAYLLSLPAVTSVKGNRITYSQAFRHQCMERYRAGESPSALFSEAGLDPDLIGHKRIERAFARWRRGGRAESGDARDDDSGDDVLGQRDLYRQIGVLQTKVVVLERLLGQQGALEAQGGVPKTKRFELIDDLRAEFCELCVSSACEVLNVSVGGYYRWRAANGGAAREEEPQNEVALRAELPGCDAGDGAPA